MKRDWELIRTILETVESLPSTLECLSPDQISGADPETVSYHINLLIEAGLVEGTCSTSLNAPMHCFAFRLKWAGHEFLDKIRSDTIWNRTQRLVKERGVDLSFETIVAAASQVIKAMLT